MLKEELEKNKHNKVEEEISKENDELKSNTAVNVPEKLHISIHEGLKEETVIPLTELWQENEIPLPEL